MCGIFGVSAILDEKRSLNLKSLRNELKVFVNISKKRGSDTFGFLIRSEKENYIYKINENPSKAIKRNDMKNLLNYGFLNKEIKKITVIGQTRLVTNGSKFSIKNNQPLITRNVIGVHNGIFTDFELDSTETINKEGNTINSDSLLFYEKLSSFYDNKNFINDFIKLIKISKGNFSIAYTLKNHNHIFLASNCGSLFYYYDKDSNFFAYSSEKAMLINYIKRSPIFNKIKKSFDVDLINQCLNQIIIYDPSKNDISVINYLTNNKVEPEINFNNNINYTTVSNQEINDKRFKNLQKCTKCILPSTYPLIEFDKNGICNFCKNYIKQVFLGKELLDNILDKFRSKNNKPDCLVGLSGGRDSCYGLHLLKTKYNMNPIAYTYDWGLTTDNARINAAKICGKLGIQHIIRAADIEKKRLYVRKNLFAWLNKPHLGMLPIIQAGDKEYFSYGRILSKELGLKLVIHCTGNQLEQRDFFVGFTGIKQKLKNNQSMYNYDFINKIKLFFWYFKNFIENPSYINGALLDNLNAFVSSFIAKDDFLHFYNYENWNEDEINKVLENEYGWISDKSYGKNQWRSGDGQTAFNNFVYYNLAGFSEYDQFRSNQIREGLITRDKAIELVEIDNKIKYQNLKIFSELIGFNIDSILSKISCIPKLY